jgi:hypothetical protein
VFFDGDVYERVNVLDTDDSNDYDDGVRANRNTWSA